MKAKDHRRAEARTVGPDAKRHLLESIAPSVRRWCYRFVGPCADIDDLIQEAYVELFTAIPSFRGRSAFSTYAYRITMRVASRWRKRRQRAMEREVQLELVEFELPERGPVPPSTELLKRLYRALDAISDKRRRALVLTAFEGLSHAEAAELEGCSERALRARVSKAREQLRGQLARDPQLREFLEEGA